VCRVFRRLLSIILIAAMLTGVSTTAMGEGTITAGEALFGSGSGSSLFEGLMDATDAPEPTSEPTAEPTPEPTVVPQDTPSPDATAEPERKYRTLKLGQKDSNGGYADIVMLQNRLIELGFMEGEADGIYGEGTQMAVRQFQAMNGLEQDGIAGPEMQKCLFGNAAALVTPSPDNPVVLTGDAILVQTMLTQWGFLVGKVDGLLGKTSEDAIQRFKIYVHDYDAIVPTPTPAPTPTPSPTPCPDPNAMPMVDDEPLPLVTPSPTPFAPDGQVDSTVLSYVRGEVEFKIFSQVVQMGDKGDEVRRVQRRLRQLEYLYAEADGNFGANTARALMYFQKKNNLPENGIADEATQRVLFSNSANVSDQYVGPYKIYVDISDQRVYIFRWDGAEYSIPEVTFICSTGLDESPTPTGTYQGYGKLVDGEWYYFEEFDVYAKWAYGIVGGILFHSIPYNKYYQLQTNARDLMGKKASHGCVRLYEDDAKWIYDNCPYGTTVVIQE